MASGACVFAPSEVAIERVYKSVANLIEGIQISPKISNLKPRTRENGIERKVAVRNIVPALTQLYEAQCLYGVNEVANLDPVHRSDPLQVTRLQRSAVKGWKWLSCSRSRNRKNYDVLTEI